MESRKPFLSLIDLLKLLQERGLLIEDEESARRFLHQTNYYRFSGYARELQKDPGHGDDNFKKGTSFNQVQQLMSLDSQLRHMLLQQLEIVETTIRAEYAHELGRFYGEAAFYLSESTYVDVKERPSQIVSGIVQDLSRSNSRMIGHYANTDTDSSLDAIKTSLYGSQSR